MLRVSCHCCFSAIHCGQTRSAAVCQFMHHTAAGEIIPTVAVCLPAMSGPMWSLLWRLPTVPRPMQITLTMCYCFHAVTSYSKF